MFSGILSRRASGRCEDVVSGCRIMVLCFLFNVDSYNLVSELIMT